MSFAFDRRSHDDASQHAEAILGRLQASTMPCDGPPAAGEDRCLRPQGPPPANRPEPSMRREPPMTDVPGKLPDADAARSPDPAWISSAMTGGGSHAGGPVMAAVPVGPATGGRPLRPARGARRPEFDVMRAFVVAGLVVFHSAVVFAAGTSWFVKDPRPDRGFTVFLLWGSLWGMPLLFLVSGMGVGYAMRSRTAGVFAAERLARLRIPLGHRPLARAHPHQVSASGRRVLHRHPRPVRAGRPPLPHNPPAVRHETRQCPVDGGPLQTGAACS